VEGAAANANLTDRRTTHSTNCKNRVLQAPATTAQRASYPALRCLAKPRYGSFMTSTTERRLKLIDCAKTWMSYWVGHWLVAKTVGSHMLE